jgi:hypothetical protein
VSIPVQGQIDDLGGGKTIRDWEARFELACQRCKDENVTLLGRVCPTTIKFARYLHRVHKVYPKDLWQTQVMTQRSIWAGCERKVVSKPVRPVLDEVQGQRRRPPETTGTVVDYSTLGWAARRS